MSTKNLPKKGNGNDHSEFGHWLNSLGPISGQVELRLPKWIHKLPCGCNLNGGSSKKGDPHIIQVAGNKLKHSLCGHTVATK